MMAQGRRHSLCYRKFLVKCLQIATSIFVLTSYANVAAAQCAANEVLIDEDEQYWYCSEPEAAERAAADVAAINQHLIGPEWRYRKAVIDTVGSLARPPGSQYLWGGKIRFDIGGRFVWMCVSAECTGAVAGGIDCSGLSEYGAVRAACFVRGVQALSGLDVRHLINNAAHQAAYFRSRGAFKFPTGDPNPGDFIFFKHTTAKSGADEITHVGIFLGRYRDGRIFIVHASSRVGRVIFDKLKPEDRLTKKIAGYGDISILTP